MRWTTKDYLILVTALLLKFSYSEILQKECDVDDLDDEDDPCWNDYYIKYSHYYKGKSFIIY